MSVMLPLRCLSAQWTITSLKVFQKCLYSRCIDNPWHWPKYTLFKLKISWCLNADGSVDYFEQSSLLVGSEAWERLSSLVITTSLCLLLRNTLICAWTKFPHCNHSVRFSFLNWCSHCWWEIMKTITAQYVASSEVWKAVMLCFVGN